MQEKANIPAQVVRQSKPILLSFTLLFYSGRPQWIKRGPPQWEGQSSSLRLLIQMLTSPKSALIDTPRNVWALHDPVKLAPMINHHRHLVISIFKCYY